MKSALIYILVIATLCPIVFGQTLTVLGSLATTPEFAAFYRLLTPVRNVFNTPGPITVFAPTNQAVQEFLSSLPAGFNDPVLTRGILLYHIVPGYILLENITEASPILAFNGGYINVTMLGTTIAVDTFALILSQFPQVNGNIFTINRVMIPPGVALPGPPTSLPQVPTLPVRTSLPQVPTLPVRTSLPQVPTLTVPTPAPPQFGVCRDQACCTARALPNAMTGDGYLEFNPICFDGGLHCEGESGCLLCHDPSIPVNVLNRPLCNATTIEPYAPCTNQACCTARMVPNFNTGYGFLEFVPRCDDGGLHCFDEIGCVSCFNPLPGAVNVYDRPVCSPEVIAIFNRLPRPTFEVERVTSIEPEVITEASTVLVASVGEITVPAKRAILDEASEANLALPAIFGVFLALMAVV